MPQHSAQQPYNKDTCKHSIRNRRFAPTKGLPPHKPDHLFPGCPKAAHHAKKFCPACNTAVHACCNHKNPCNYYQHGQHCGYKIKLHQIGIPALEHEHKNLRILSHLFQTQTKLAAYLINCLLDIAKRPEFNIIKHFPSIFAFFPIQCRKPFRVQKNTKSIQFRCQCRVFGNSRNPVFLYLPLGSGHFKSIPYFHPQTDFYIFINDSLIIHFRKCSLHNPGIRNHFLKFLIKAANSGFGLIYPIPVF